VRSSSERVLQVVDLRKTYGKFEALKGINFDLKRGEILGYLGPNGAGKTTTLNILGGVIRRSSGKILFSGEPIEPDSSLDYKMKLSYLPEDASVYEHFTVNEVVNFYYNIYNLELSRKTVAYELLEIFGLSDYLSKQIYGFSKGMKQKLLFVLTVMTDPEILLLDEPLASMDAESTIIVREIIKDLKSKGKAIIFSSHILEVIEKVCDRVVIINKGKVIAQGTMDEIMKMSSLEEFFTRLTGKDILTERVEKAKKVL